MTDGWPAPDADAPMHGLAVAVGLTLLLALALVTTYLLFTT